MKLSAFCLSCAVVTGIALIHAAPAQAEAISTELIEQCPIPALPSIPNGMKATEEEMLAAQKIIKAYIAEAEETLACLDAIRLEWGEEASAEQLEINNLFYDKQVEDMQATGELFNSAVRAFKGRQQ